jgi:hypothetical protein
MSNAAARGLGWMWSAGRNLAEAGYLRDFPRELQHTRVQVTNKRQGSYALLGACACLHHGEPRRDEVDLVERGNDVEH